MNVSNLSGMQAVSSFTGCCVCTHCWSTQHNYDGYRRFLDSGSRGRRRRVVYRGYTYEYFKECTRPAPKYRDTQFVRLATAFAKQRDAPYMGHKHVPLLSMWPGYDWRRMNVPDVMHDIKLLVEMLLKVMIGKGIDTGEGGYKSWSKDSSHRAQAKKRNVHREIWPDINGPLPWRLTPEEVQSLDQRMGRVSWPRYVDRMHYEGCSFWKKPGRLWKTQRKVVLFYFVLATQLRDKLPRLRVALFLIIWALRRLDGQVHSFDAARNLNILPGSRTIDPLENSLIHRDLIVGLCLLEGCLPVAHLHPALHHLVHFAQYAMTHGCLRTLWMMYFERCVNYLCQPHLTRSVLVTDCVLSHLNRYNKHIKNLVRDVSHPEAHLGNSVSADVSARYMDLVMHKTYGLTTDYHHLCVLSCPDRRFVSLSRKEVTDFRMLGYHVDSLSASAFHIAHIMGIHFRAGEWNESPRCGSVITLTRVVNKRPCSYYARVVRFLKIGGDDSPGFASVRWFSKPTYPHGTPLVVCASEDGSLVDFELGSIVKLTQIEPSRVMVESDLQPGRFYMMRDSGYDRV